MEDESGQPGEWGFKAMKQVVKLRLKGCADGSTSTKEEEEKKKTKKRGCFFWVQQCEEQKEWEALQLQE